MRRQVLRATGQGIHEPLLHAEGFVCETRRVHNPSSPRRDVPDRTGRGYSQHAVERRAREPKYGPSALHERPRGKPRGLSHWQDAELLCGAGRVSKGSRRQASILTTVKLIKKI